MTLTELERELRELQALVRGDLSDRMPVPARYPEPQTAAGGWRFGAVRDIGDGTGDTIQVQFLKRKSTAPYWAVDGAAQTVRCCPDHDAGDYEWLMLSPSGEFTANAGWVPIWLVNVGGVWVALPWAATETIVEPDSVDRTDAYPIGDGTGGGQTGTIPATVSGGTPAQTPSKLCELEYDPADVSDWSGGVDPGKADEAVDQLADRTKALEVGAVMKALFGAYSILTADEAGTPLSRAMAASRLVGRKDTGGVGELTPAEARTVLGNPLLADGSVALTGALNVGNPPNGIKDANGNWLLKWGVVGSAVNYVQIANMLSGVGPSMSAKGTDEHIDLLLVSKGANGHVKADGSRVLAEADINDSGTGSTDLYSAQRILALLKQSRGLTRKAPTGSDDWRIWHTPIDITISRVRAITDTGTVTFQLKWRVESSPFSGGTNILSSSLVADDTGEATTSSFSDATIPAGSVICYVASAVASSPGELDIYVEFTPD